MELDLQFYLPWSTSLNFTNTCFKSRVSRFYLPDGRNRKIRSGFFLPLFEEDSELYKPLYSPAFELLLRGLLSNKQRSIKTVIVVDELGALNQLRSLYRLLSESPKFGGCAFWERKLKRKFKKFRVSIIC